MCLSISPETLNCYQVKRRKTTRKYAWKVLKKGYGKTLTSKVYNNFEWKVGWNHSGRTRLPITRVEKTEQKVQRGIHVYASKQVASRFVHWDDERVVKVKVDEKDLVAQGLGAYSSAIQAVYRKVFLSQEEFDKATGE